MADHYHQQPNVQFRPQQHRQTDESHFKSYSHQSQESSGSGPSTTKVVAVATLVPVGGILLGLSGLSLVATLIGLALATPLFLLFSPILIPATLVVAGSVAGFLASGAFGITGLSSFSWIANFLRQGARDSATWWQQQQQQQQAEQAQREREQQQQQQQEEVDQAKQRAQEVAGQLGQRTKEVGQKNPNKSNEAGKPTATSTATNPEAGSRDHESAAKTHDATKK